MSKFDLDKWMSEHMVQENADTLVQLREVGDASAIGEQQGTRREVVLIEAGWGSSGYYSKELLTRDGPSAWPKGTQMYLDHPSVSEEHDRPERSVKDLAAVISSTPKMQGNQLVAEADIFDHWAPVINGLAENIGLSIRAAGEMEPGEAEGRNGNIITALTEGISVDFVTQAGAGGKVGQLIESARQRQEESVLEEARNATDYLASKIHSNFTDHADHLFGQGYMTREDRKGLSKAIGLALDAFNDHVESTMPHLSQRDPYDEPMDPPVLTSEALRLDEAHTVTLERDISKDERVALAKKGQAIPIKDKDGNIIGGRFPMANCSDVKNAAQSIGRGSSSNAELKSFITRVAKKLSCPSPFKTESGSGRGKESAVEVDEKTLSEMRESQRQLEDKVKENETKLSEATTRAERAEDALLQSRARGLVERTIREGQEGENPLPSLPERATERVIERALQGNLPVDSDGKLIESELVERVRAAAKAEHEYLAPASGAGRVNGTGAIAESGNDNGSAEEKPLDEAEQKKLVESFKKLGLSDKAAQTAAEGR